MKSLRSFSSKKILSWTTIIAMMFSWASPVATALDLGRISSISVGAQTGTLQEGTGGTVTYQVTITKSGTGAGSSSAGEYSISSVLPAGVTAEFDPVGFVFGPGGATTRTATLTLTTSDSTPAGSTSFTVQSETLAGEIDTVNGTLAIDDVTAPIITLLGDDPVDVEQGSSYTDDGATAEDNLDGDITDEIVIVNPVDTNTLGAYTVTYDVSDAAGNPATQVTRTVNVVESPVEAFLEITYPAADGDEVEKGVAVEFRATYIDDDDTVDTVNFAIKPGTECPANTPELNIAGFGTADNNSTYDSETGEFVATVDLSDDPAGDYCLVVNPIEQPGEDNLKEVRVFSLVDAPEPKTTSTVIVRGDTSAGENQAGWLFNRDQSTKTPFEFNFDAPSIGDGSVYVLPIGSNPSDKFIAEYFFLDEIAGLGSVTYDYQIGSGGTLSDANEFYMNVYANFGESSVTNFYDCRYNIVPSVGAVGSYTTVTFDPTQTYPVTTRGSSPYPCPGSPADMDTFSPGSTIRVFAINVGDTSANDTGLDGYLDNIVVDTTTSTTTFDLEPVALPECSESDHIGNTTFDTFSLGNVNGQNGWKSTGSFDQEVVRNTYGYNTFGCQTLRISNAVTAGSFGDQTFAAPLADSVGEVDATAGSFAEGTRYNHYEASFDIASAVPGSQQSGLALSVSPDRGDGSRMSYLGFVDGASGIEVTFYDVAGTTSPVSFVPTSLGTLDRTVPHNIKFVIDVKDGASNDEVEIYIDGALVHTGTTWENYYRYDNEASAEQSPRLIKTLIFRASGAAAAGNDGKGFLLDNMSLSASDEVEFIPPTCNDLTATIYVDDAGIIHGGPDDGNVYAGTLTGTTGDDVIVGTQDADIILADEGNDTICALGGADHVEARNGNDLIFGGEGDDTLHGQGGADEIYGEGGNDTINGQNNPDILDGGDGEDTINGGNGNDTISGGPDADTIEGGNGDDMINGNNGGDYICGNDGNDTINGNNGHDTLCGGLGDDTINGGNGSDEIDGDEGEDTLNGGNGSDTCTYGEAVSNCEDTTTLIEFCEDKKEVEEEEEEEISESVITQPTASEVTSGVTQLEAYYVDEDDDLDGVDWAIRTGLCVTNSTTTVYGNVNGRNDPYSFDGDYFLADFDTTTVPNGDYCFIFNPREDSGATNQRLKQDFSVDNEDDEIKVCEAKAVSDLNTSTGTPGVDEMVTQFNVNLVTYQNGEAFDLFVEGDVSAQGQLSDEVAIERTTDGFRLFFYGNPAGTIKEFSGSFFLEDVDFSAGQVAPDAEGFETNGDYVDQVSINTTTGEVSFHLYVSTGNDSFVVTGLQEKTDCSDDGGSTGGGDGDEDPYGTISSPEENDEFEIGDVLSLIAQYFGNETEPVDVQWAVRKDSCSVPGVNVAGNVGGFSSPYSWDGQDFSASLDTSDLDAGNYCFIFNPTDDGDVRETVIFSLVEPEEEEEEEEEGSTSGGGGGGVNTTIEQRNSSGGGGSGGGGNGEEEDEEENSGEGGEEETTTGGGNGEEEDEEENSGDEGGSPTGSGTEENEEDNSGEGGNNNEGGEENTQGGGGEENGGGNNEDSGGNTGGTSGGTGGTGGTSGGSSGGTFVAFNAPQDIGGGGEGEETEGDEEEEEETNSEDEEDNEDAEDIGGGVGADDSSNWLFWFLLFIAAFFLLWWFFAAKNRQEEEEAQRRRVS